MSVGSSILHGREAEVSHAVEVVTDDVGGHVAVVGVAGIGKSAVIHAVTDRVAGTGTAVRGTVGAVSERGLPFAGLHDLIGPEVETRSVDLPPSLQVAVDVAVLRSGAGEVDPLALNLAVLRVVEQLSQGRRLLLVLDDLPWVDVATRSTLMFVLRRLPPDRVSTLASYRPDAADVDVVPPGAVRTIPLGPLAVDPLVAVVEDRLGVKVPHRLARQLHAASGGNPLLAIELARGAAADQGPLRELTVPERYRAILAPRLATLSPDARRALLAASLLARPTLEGLVDVVPISGVLEAESAGVIRLADGAVRFAHPLYAALCREEAPSSERLDMHGLLAKAAGDDVEQARHLGAATLLPDEGVAAQLAEVADRARQRAAVAAAGDLMLTALRVTPSADLDRRASRACTAAELIAETGDLETAAVVLRRVLDDLPPGPSRGRCLTALGRALSEDAEGATAVFHEVLRQPGLDPETEYEARFEIARIRLDLGDIPGSLAALAEVESDATTSGHHDAARECRWATAWAGLLAGTPLARSTAWQRLVGERDAFGDLDYDHPDLLEAWEAMSQEDNTRSLALIDERMRRAQAAGSTAQWAMLAMHRGATQLRRGDIEAACDDTDRAYRILADGEHDEAALYFRSLALAWNGRLELARADAENALAMARRHRNRLFEIPAEHALGFVDLSAGDVGAAARHYEVVAAGMAAMGWRYPSLVAWHGNAVESFVATGRREAAADVVGQLAAVAEDCALTTGVALALRCRALLLEDAGDLDGAAAALDESVGLSQPLENPLEHARSLLVRGVVQRRLRHKAASREDLRCAWDLFVRHGAIVWAVRAERELQRSTAAASGTELTGAERAVAELVAAGATNREAGAALYLSEKTVEAILTRVYRKLSVRSRTQLAHLLQADPGPGSAGARGPDDRG